MSPGKKHGILETNQFLLFRAVRICLRVSVTSLRFVCLSLQKERVARYRLTTRGRQRAGQTSFRIFQLTAPMQGSTRLMFPLCSRQPRRPFSFDSRRARNYGLNLRIRTYCLLLARYTLIAKIISNIFSDINRSHGPWESSRTVFQTARYSVRIGMKANHGILEAVYRSILRS